jgi:hypothetical protein
MSTYNEQMQKYVAEYRADGGEWPTTSREMAAWIINKGLWKPQSSELISICAEQLARAMREEYVIDPQGRKVRSKHAARIQQTVLWDDIRTASREHMVIAFQQRRQQIVGDCHQLKLDLDSYNENKNDGKPIQMVFDFTEDLNELESESKSLAELKAVKVS